MEGFKDKLKTCLQDEPAFCTAACPFHMDMGDFAEKMGRKSFNAAFKTYRNAVGFPAIVAELCHRPCIPLCPMEKAGGSIDIGMLERAALTHAKNTEPTEYNLPHKTGRIAIIGAGISGLACALRLCTKKYKVDIYEQSGNIGGSLLKILPPELVTADIEKQFKHEDYTLHLNTRVESLDDLCCDAIYVATGKDGCDFGCKPESGNSFAGTRPGVFFGGGIRGSEGVTAIADGLQAATPIEGYIKVGSMNAFVPGNTTRMHLDSHAIRFSQAIKPSSEEGFTADEAAAEAKRCLRCRCDACKRHCDMMRIFNKYPQRLKDEVDVTIYPATLDGKGTLAKLPISSCNQCGLCKDVCPRDIDMGEFLLQSRAELHRKNALPWAYHDFWLRDMEFAFSDRSYICRRPQGFDNSRYVFYPGCQLGASDIRYVTAPYELLLNHYPDTALTLGCCGAPAIWAGDEKLHQETISKIKNDWLCLGSPKAIFACPTCKQMFERYLPEIEGIFLYNLIADWPLDRAPDDAAHRQAALFDPCSSRHEPGLRQAVRHIVSNLGFETTPLPFEGDMAQCCTWGGQVSIANPAYARQVSQKRVDESPLPYITYCVNCRDIFADRGKECCHISDIMFGLNGWDRHPPTITQRRLNRVALKSELLKKYWNEDHMKENYKEKYRVHIPDELKNKLSEEMILEEDAAKTARHCQDTNCKVLNKESGRFSGHMTAGYTTIWVEYTVFDDICVLTNAYSHRMTIEEV